VMGWGNYHIYLFTVGRQDYGEGVSEWAEFAQNPRQRKTCDAAGSCRPQRRPFHLHVRLGRRLGTRKVEEIRDGAPEPARCIAGARCCPPEGCGGPFGYQEMLEIIFDPKHPEYLERRDWLGEGFDPERFNVEVVNRELKRLKVGREAA